MAVAAELRRLRKSKGLSQKDLALISGIPAVSIQRYETGGSIRIDHMSTLSRSLEAEPAELFARASRRVEEVAADGDDPAVVFAPSSDTVKRV